MFVLLSIENPATEVCRSSPGSPPPLETTESIGNIPLQTSSCPQVQPAQVSALDEILEGTPKESKRRPLFISRGARCPQMVVPDLPLHIPKQHPDGLPPIHGPKRDQPGDLELDLERSTRKGRDASDAMPLNKVVIKANPVI